MEPVRTPSPSVEQSANRMAEIFYIQGRLPVRNITNVVNTFPAHSRPERPLYPLDAPALDLSPQAGSPHERAINLINAWPGPDAGLHHAGPSGLQSLPMAGKEHTLTTRCEKVLNESSLSDGNSSYEPESLSTVRQPSPAASSGMLSTDYNDGVSFQDRYWNKQKYTPAMLSNQRIVEIDLKSCSSDSDCSALPSASLLSPESAERWILQYLKPLSPEKTDQRLMVLMAIYFLEKNARTTKLGFNYNDLKKPLEVMNDKNKEIKKITHPVLSKDFKKILPELKNLQLVRYSLHFENIRLTKCALSGLSEMLKNGHLIDLHKEEMPETP